MPSRSFASEFTSIQCKHDYFDIYAGNALGKDIALTVLVAILTIALEVIVHSDICLRLTRKPEPKLSPPSPPPPYELPVSAPTATTSFDESRDGFKRNSPWFNPSTAPPPSPSIRANRLTLATILIIPICIAFGFRMADTVPPRVRYECISVLKESMTPWWGAIVVFSIFPFTIACAAWLRAFVDCLLVRRGEALRFPDIAKGNLVGWPPAAPLYYVVIVPVIVFGWWVRRSIGWLMGRPDVVSGTKSDIELNEEYVRLVDDADEGEDGKEEETFGSGICWQDAEITGKGN